MMQADIATAGIVETGPAPDGFDAAFRLLVAACDCRGVQRAVILALLDGDAERWPPVFGPMPVTLLARTEAEVVAPTRHVQRSAATKRRHRAAKLVLGIVRERVGGGDIPGAARALARMLRRIERTG